jgi:hypothetical protein
VRVFAGGRRAAGAVLGLPGSQLVARGLVVVTGAGALVLAFGGRLDAAGIIALVAAPGVVAAAVAPGSWAATSVVWLGALAWAVRYGTQPPSLVPALLVAMLLYLHHLVAALLAGVSGGAALDPVLTRRWARHAATVLGITAVAALVLSGITRSTPSSTLELLGLAAGVATVGGLVAISGVAGIADAHRREPQ